MNQDGVESKLEIIRHAIQGKNEALELILNQYAPYINRLSTVYSTTGQGEETSYIDEDIQAQLRQALIRALRRFDLDGIIHGTRQFSSRSASNHGKRSVAPNDADSDQPV